MIQLITQCGIGLLVGCVLTLAFLPLLRRSAVHSTKRELAAVSPLITGDIQAEKDQMRAEFVMSIRRLEIGMENLREKAIARLGPADKRATEINHLQAELDNKAALIVTLRGQAEWHKTVARKIVKLLLYIFARTRRRQRTAVVAPLLFKFERGPQWELEKQPVQRGYASAATPITARTRPVPTDLATTVTFAAKAHPVESDRAVAAPAILAKIHPAQNGLATTVTPLAPKEQPPQSDLAATAAAIAAVNLKRRRAISNKV